MTDLKDMNIPDNPHQQWFAEVWRSREEEIYPRLFSASASGIFKISDQLFQMLGQTEIDPRWKTLNVLYFAPTTPDGGHIYVTNGLSTPWGLIPDKANPREYSGLGFEFFMQFSQRSDFAGSVLLWLAAVQTLTGCGLLEGELVGPLDRVALGRPITGNSPLISLFLFPPEELPPQFQLASGCVDLLCMTGITAAEADFARSQGSEVLLELLRHHECLSRTNIHRVSVV